MPAAATRRPAHGACRRRRAKPGMRRRARGRSRRSQQRKEKAKSRPGAGRAAGVGVASWIIDSTNRRRVSLVRAALSASGAPARASRHRAFLDPWAAPAPVRFLVQWTNGSSRSPTFEALHRLPTTADQRAVARVASRRVHARRGRAAAAAARCCRLGSAGAASATPAQRRSGAAPQPPRHRRSRFASRETLQPPPRGDAARELPIILRAARCAVVPTSTRAAEGDVEFRRGGTVIRADKLSYDQAEDLARATGNVVISRDGNVFSGPELQLQDRALRGLLSHAELPLRAHRRRRQGEPDRVHRRAARGRDRRDVLELQHRRRDGEPAWILKARRAAHRPARPTKASPRTPCCASTACRSWPSPVLSFPLSEERKSGLLPPSFGIDSRSGFQVAIPYYWNIAPNRDATFTLQDKPRRGPSLETEFRYLEPRTSARSTQGAAERQRRRALALRRCTAEHEGGLPYNAFAQLRLHARLRRRLLEGLSPARSSQPDAAPAADRPAR